jgi:hypothetical protein
VTADRPLDAVKAAAISNSSIAAIDVLQRCDCTYGQIEGALETGCIRGWLWPNSQHTTSVKNLAALTPRKRLVLALPEDRDAPFQRRAERELAKMRCPPPWRADRC